MTPMGILDVQVPPSKGVLFTTQAQSAEPRKHKGRKPKLAVFVFCGILSGMKNKLHCNLLIYNDFWRKQRPLQRSMP